MATANFFAPGFDDQVEQQNIERQRKMADLLRQQSAEPMQNGSMVSGHYVAPSFTQGLAKLLQGYNAGKMGEEADAKQKALAEAVKGRATSEMGQFTNLLTGRPADTLPEDQQGPVRAAQAPDLNAAYQYAAKAQTPALQQFGVQGALTSAEEQAKLARAKALQQQQLQLWQASGNDPQKFMQLGGDPKFAKEMAEAPTWGKKRVVINGQLVNEADATPVGAAIPKQADPVNVAKDLLIPDPNNPGKFIPNQALVGVKTGIAKAGAPNVRATVNMPDKKFYEGLGTAVSGQIEKGFEQAQAATQTLNNANQIASGLEKAFVGPMANQRMTLAQLGQTLGITGKDTEEALLNTRNVIQGLARQELAAAGQMKGQGQITESERAILRKAESGDISSFTKPELQLFVGAIRKTARSRIATHQRNLDNLKTDKEAGTILPYLQIDVPEDAPLAAPTAPAAANRPSLSSFGKKG
jgi:hypothetical protein